MGRRFTKIGIKKRSESLSKMQGYVSYSNRKKDGLPGRGCVRCCTTTNSKLIK